MKTFIKYLAIFVGCMAISYFVNIFLDGIEPGMRDVLIGALMFFFFIGLGTYVDSKSQNKQN